MLRKHTRARVEYVMILALPHKHHQLILTTAAAELYVASVRIFQPSKPNWDIVRQ